MQDVLSLILGGGRGARLYPLTKHRSEPAVPIAGKYRLIDIPVSNCLNSGLNRVYVLTQYLSVSLHRHIAHTYKFDPFSRGFVEVLAAQQTNEAADWYQGTADAVRQNLPYVQADGARDILILSGDQLYHMDFHRLVKAHRASGAGVTIALAPVGRAQAQALGVVRVDESDRVVRFVEKPQTEEELAPLRLPAGWLAGRGLCPPAGQGREYLANMGIYLFTRPALFELLLSQPLAANFTTEIFPHFLASHRLQAHMFTGYWEDVGSIKAYHQANLALAGSQPPFEFHGPEGVIYTRMRNLPAARLSAAEVNHCLMSDGCIVEAGARLERCVVGVRSRIGPNAVLRDTVMIGVDRYETEAERAQNRQGGLPDFGVGEGSVIERAILDKDCRIGSRVRIVNNGSRPDGEGSNYVIRDGIVVIPNGAVVPDNTGI
jgi:glucose-1-phosphate adenylyltransferase